eukprot:TRINITY_DN21600_c0_g1_i1.p1 TRINITY_DN21600_c0_g1~~TRINITY_DN21600_c0_g1_i1.p1  ORF type:complete len:274 (+),score=15.92 TRINITY_DN21600_c0_g1_i1:70-822(+)
MFIGQPHSNVGTPSCSSSTSFHSQYPGAQFARGQFDVTDVNHDLVAVKRRRELEDAIREKEALLVSYRNGGVDANSIGILQRHVEGLRGQLAGIPQPVHVRAVPGYQAVETPSIAGSVGSGPNGRMTKRDEVYLRKRADYLRRVAASSSRGSTLSHPPSTSSSSISSKRMTSNPRLLDPSLVSHPATAPPPPEPSVAAPHPSAVSTQIQPQARHGRRATPPSTSATPVSSGFLNFGSEPKQGYGRRRQQF